MRRHAGRLRRVQADVLRRLGILPLSLAVLFSPTLSTSAAARRSIPDTGYYATGDWTLEMNRVLRLVGRGKVILAQSYLDPVQVSSRLFVLGSYLLLKGTHTFINMWIGAEPQWFPEYGLDLGRALRPVPRTIGRLAIGRGLFERRYQRGVVVNLGGSAKTLATGPSKMLRPVGGGALDGSADTRGWGLAWDRTTGLRIPAHSAAVYRSATGS